MTNFPSFFINNFSNIDFFDTFFFFFFVLVFKIKRYTQLLASKIGNFYKTKKFVLNGKCALKNFLYFFSHNDKLKKVIYILKISKYQVI